MGYLRERSTYRSKARFYKGGPTCGIEFYKAADNAKIFQGENVFYPMGFFFRERGPTVGELTGNGVKRKYFNGVWDGKPDGQTVAGTAADFAGKSIYPGPTPAACLPNCASTVSVLTSDCHTTGNTPNWVCPESYPCLAFIEMKGFALASGSPDWSGVDGKWALACRSDDFEFTMNYSSGVGPTFLSIACVISYFGAGFSILNISIVSASAGGTAQYISSDGGCTGIVNFSLSVAGGDLVSAWPATLRVSLEQDCFATSPTITAGGETGCAGLTASRGMMGGRFFASLFFSPRFFGTGGALPGGAGGGMFGEGGAGSPGFFGGLFFSPRFF